MGITKLGTRITLDYVDGDPFGNIADPFTYQRVVDAIISNGWVGLYAQKGDTIIFEDISIYIQGSETAFVDSEKNITYTGNPDDGNVYRVNFDVAKHELDECSIKGMSSNHINIHLTSSIITNSIIYQFDLMFIYGRYENCWIKNADYITLENSNQFIECELKNIGTLGIKYNTILEQTRVIDSIFRPDSRYEFDIELNKIYVISDNRLFNIRIGDKTSVFKTTDSKLSLDDYLITAIYSGSGTLTIILQKTFNVNIQNSAAGILTIKDKNGNEVYSEVLTSDQMTEQKIEYDKLYLENNDGELTAEERTKKEPFTLTVEKTGYQTLEIPNIYCTIDGVGTLSSTVVEGGMVLVEVTGENLQHFITEDVLEHVITEDKLTHEITD